MESLFNEFVDYLQSNSISDEGKRNIKGILIESPDFIKVNFVRFLRPDNETENKSIVEKDISGNEVIIHRYSQINELLKSFGLPNDNNDVKIKLNEYLNQFLEFQKHL